MKQSSRSKLARLLRQFRREDGVGMTTPTLWIGSLLMLIIALQAGIWFLSNTVAQAAAQAAYTTARAYESSAASGQQAAADLIQSMNGYLVDVTVDVDRAGDQVTVTLSGSAPSLLAGVPLPPIEHTITGPVERWEPAP